MHDQFRLKSVGNIGWLNKQRQHLISIQDLFEVFWKVLYGNCFATRINSNKDAAGSVGVFFHMILACWQFHYFWTVLRGEKKETFKKKVSKVWQFIWFCWKAYINCTPFSHKHVLNEQIKGGFEFSMKSWLHFHL